MTRLALLLGSLALLAVGCTAAAQTPPPPNPPAGPTAGITVSGQGRVEGRPDTLRATVGVEVSRPAVQEALDAANEAATAVMEALRSAGVAEEDIQTRDLAVEPQYRYPENGTPEITGYVVRNLVELTTTDLDAVGDLLDTAVRAGGDAARLQGVAFSLEDNAELLDAARGQAFAEARRKAEQYAELAGRGLGEVVSVAETSALPPPMPLSLDQAAAAEGRAIPVQPGTQELTVTVTVVYAFG